MAIRVSLSVLLFFAFIVLFVSFFFLFLQRLPEHVMHVYVKLKELWSYEGLVRGVMV